LEIVVSFTLQPLNLFPSTDPSESTGYEARWASELVLTLGIELRPSLYRLSYPRSFRQEIQKSICPAETMTDK
jgi:hypothetical protein